MCQRPLRCNKAADDRPTHFSANCAGHACADRANKSEFKAEVGRVRPFITWMPPHPLGRCPTKVAKNDEERQVSPDLALFTPSGGSASKGGNGWFIDRTLESRHWFVPRCSWHCRRQPTHVAAAAVTAAVAAAGTGAAFMGAGGGSFQGQSGFYGRGYGRYGYAGLGFYGFGYPYWGDPYWYGWNYSDYGYPYDYSYGYDPSAVAAPSSTAPAAQNYWYYCGSANRYYPYVRSCPEGWQKVLATPPASSQQSINVPTTSARHPLAESGSAE